MKYFAPKINALTIVMTPRRQRLMKCFQNGALRSSAFLPSIDPDLQRFFNEYFVDTDSNDDDAEFDGFKALPHVTISSTISLTMLALTLSLQR